MKSRIYFRYFLCSNSRDEQGAESDDASSSPSACPSMSAKGGVSNRGKARMVDW